MAMGQGGNTQQNSTPHLGVVGRFTSTLHVRSKEGELDALMATSILSRSMYLNNTNFPYMLVVFFPNQFVYLFYEWSLKY